MKTFILMTKLSGEMSGKLKERKDIGRLWLNEVKNKCPEVKFKSHYALLGKYDFLDIYEAPDEETAAKVSMISLANGAKLAESWTAIPYNRFLKLIEEI
ncbi:MAG: GYD domain-containing protein [Ignavibacteria bacterium]